jgi:hypothetical protein
MRSQQQSILTLLLGSHPNYYEFWFEVSLPYVHGAPGQAASYPFYWEFLEWSQSHIMITVIPTQNTYNFLQFEFPTIFLHFQTYSADSAFWELNFEKLSPCITVGEITEYWHKEPEIYAWLPISSFATVSLFNFLETLLKNWQNWHECFRVAPGRWRLSSVMMYRRYFNLTDNCILGEVYTFQAFTCRTTSQVSDTPLPALYMVPMQLTSTLPTEYTCSLTTRACNISICTSIV